MRISTEWLRLFSFLNPNEKEMKRNLLKTAFAWLFLTMLAPLTASADDILINETNFPDENFRNYLLSQSYGQDGKITDDEIESITYMSVNNKYISSLQGIEYFTALTSLECYSNQLTSLDVSKNTALVTLYCYRNQLTSLNVSGCRRLNSLYCYYNQIKGAAMNALIRSLSLPVVGVGMLRILCDDDDEGNVCTRSQVAAIFGKRWTPLYHDGNDWIGYEGSKVEVAINETNFPDEKFRNWLLEQDYGTDGIISDEEIKSITEIEVESQGISSLQGIEYFTELEYLDCRFNQLTSLDVSGCTALTILFCNNNQLTSLNVSDCTNLQYVECSGNQIKGSAMDELIYSLPIDYYDEREICICDENDGNVYTNRQIAAIRARGWTPYYYSANKKYEIVEYEVTEGEILIDETKFPDRIFRKYLVQQDYGRDGVITDEEIESITSIEITDYYSDYGNEPYLKSLQGIEYFTALTELNCSGNGLTFLDVSGCKSLTKLNCSNNKLTLLDVSKYTALTSLDCSKNQLNSLDVSQNTALTELICGANSLGTLDVLSNTALTSLDCSKNQLISLDVSQNTALTKLICGANSLGILDVSNNKALISLGCNSNLLSSLDVSKNTALTSLVCGGNQLETLDVSSNKALTSLDCSRSRLSSLDVSNNTALTELNCSNNSLETLDVLKNTALTSLDCGNNPLGALDVSKNTALTELYCYQNKLTSLDVSNCSALTRLSCYDNQLTSLDVSGCGALTWLDCWFNQIKGTAMDALIESLPIRSRAPFTNFYMIDINYPDFEGNVCTRSQVAVVNAKGWLPRFHNGVLYEGSDDTESVTIYVDADGIATYCSPYDLTITETDGLKAYIASGYDQATGTVLLTCVTEVPAGTGIMLMGNEGVHAVSIRPTQYYYVNMLKGTLAALPLPQEEDGYTNYILANGSEGVKFYRSSGNGSIAANRAYLQVPTSVSLAGARRVLNYAFEDNETTGIHQAQGMQLQDGAVYNLNGQRVEQPRSGLYIKNGKKVFIH